MIKRARREVVRNVSRRRVARSVLLGMSLVALVAGSAAIPGLVSVPSALAQTEFTVTYDGNGATAGSVPVDPSSPYLSGATVTVLDNTGSLVDPGYSFEGWNTSSTGGGTAYAAGATFTILADTTLYAVWAPNSDTVTYDGNGATAGSVPVDPSSPYLSGATVTVLDNTGSLVDPGYSFEGWNTSSTGGGTAYAAGATFTILADTTLYAVWAPNSEDVTFNANGGSGSMGPESYTSGVAQALTPNTLTWTGYTFTGWNTAADGSGTAYSDGQLITIDAALTLYARWSANNENVTFDANGGGGSMSPESYTSGVAQALTPNTLTWTGYTFTGWNTAADGSGTAYSDGQLITIDAALTLYARWSANNENVTFDANGGGGSMSPESYTSGVAQALTPNTLTWTGYTFTGWNTAADGSGTAYSDGQLITIDAALTLYARWKAKPVSPEVTITSTEAKAKPVSPEVTITSTEATIQGSNVAVDLACARAACSGEAELSGLTGARTTNLDGTSAKRERVVLAVGRYELTEGSTATVLVPLTVRGLDVIASASTRLLPATLVVTVRGGKKATKSARVLPAVSAARVLVAGTRFFIPAPLGGAVRQDTRLKSQGNLRDAALISKMLATSHAVWFDGKTPQGGTQTPKQVQVQVSQIMREAAGRGSVPVLVTFNIPGRDCERAGAVDEAAYDKWIDAFARGIGGGKAVVILEPDSLANLPSDCLKNDASLNSTTYPFSDAERLAEINYSVRAIERDPQVSVYLDGGDSAWQPAGTIAETLVRAGVQNAQGFVLNVFSNQYTANSIAYGTWVSDCIAYGVFVRPGYFSSCPNQYWNGGPSGTEIAKLLRAWHGVALNSYGIWSDSTTTADLNISGIDASYASLLGSTKPVTHFVIDTSLNGRGMNNMTAYASAPYYQPASVISALVSSNLCNPPDTGLGLAPTTDTGETLVDAYLWVKNPGESTGQCESAGGSRAWDFNAYTQPGWPTSVEARSLFDPLWGRIDPVSGSWFPEFALQLVNDAVQSREAPQNR